MADDFWEKHYGITPQPVAEIDVWRAAHQMLKMFPNTNLKYWSKRCGLIRSMPGPGQQLLWEVVR